MVVIDIWTLGSFWKEDIACLLEHHLVRHWGGEKGQAFWSLELPLSCHSYWSFPREQWPFPLKTELLQRSDIIVQ